MISPDGVVSEISDMEAIALRNGALMRPGNVTLEHSNGSLVIKDERGSVILTPIRGPGK